MTVNRLPYFFGWTQVGENHERKNTAYGDEYFVALGENEQIHEVMVMNDVPAEGRIATKDRGSLNHIGRQ